MNNMKENEKEKTKIIAYGISSLRYEHPEEIKGRNYVLTFHDAYTEENLSDYDIVILFADTFEKTLNGKIICTNEDEKLKRLKQIDKLIKNGGLVCCLFYEIVDSYVIKDVMYSRTIYVDNLSIGKNLLNYSGIDKGRRSINKEPLRYLTSKREEYNTYLEVYGVTKTYFHSIYNKNLNAIIHTGNTPVGIIAFNEIIFLPCHAPDYIIDDTKKLFSTLAQALVVTKSDISYEMPNWVNNITFPKEKELVNEKNGIEKELGKITDKMKLYTEYKNCLCLKGDPLVISVANILERVFLLKTDTTEDFKEDIKIILPNNKLIAIAEIKGVNAGVKREYINQTDTHRENLGLKDSFPALLIINTHLRARNLKEKNKKVASEQIKKAIKNNILIIRTLDLINLIKHFEDNKLNTKDFIRLIKTNAGWLKVTKDEIMIISE